MQNPFCMDIVVAISESESKNELVSISGQLPSELAAQLPAVVVENSSDIHIGPHFPYSSPVTVNQYITVKGKGDIGSLAGNLCKNADTISPQPPEGANPGDAALKHPSKDVLTFQKDAWLRNRYVWSLFVFVLVAAITTALVVALLEAESTCVPPSKNPLDRQHVVVCYVRVLASRSPGLGRFTVDNIDPTLCTHLVYAFATLNMTSNAIESVLPAYDLEENNGTGAYKKMNSLKKDYPHLKVLLAMGGWTGRTVNNYFKEAESPARRKAVIRSVSEFLRKYNFDGLDLHWQYPAEEKGVPADKQIFVSLLKEFREEFDKFGLLLTAPLGVTPDTIERSYDIPAISRYLHYMFAVCYAYYDNWKSPTGPNAPLYPRYDGDNLNVESSINTLLRKGAAKNKLVLGLPLYGRIYKLKNTEGGVGFPKEFEGAGMPGPYMQMSGYRGYNEICKEVDNPTYNWKKYWDNVTHTPYASKDNQFISYDDARSLTDKVELAVHKKLAGVVVYFLDTDDFHGSCTFGRSGSTGYPLMQAINNALDNSVSWKKVPCPSRSTATGPVD